MFRTQRNNIVGKHKIFDHIRQPILQVELYNKSQWLCSVVLLYWSFNFHKTNELIAAIFGYFALAKWYRYRNEYRHLSLPLTLCEHESHTYVPILNFVKQVIMNTLFEINAKIVCLTFEQSLNNVDGCNE